ncbi:hypothetical protein MAR_020424 [Mya arenaria]|uniref:DDE-1 domain-containing protein n=1 Tax=Mya arenaria TaxID=6604 RepID=A0ABY7E5D8_MYAAR|nr:hypothetical protein MAR_020424 [Mya arenaria]
MLSSMGKSVTGEKGENPESPLQCKSTLDSLVAMWLVKGPKTIFNEAEEKYMTNWLKEMAQRDTGICEFLDFLQGVIKREKRKVPFKDGRPGKKWYYSFINRITKSLAQDMTPFWKRNGQRCQKRKLTNGVTISGTFSKVIGPTRQDLAVPHITSGKERLTVMFCGNASGKMMSPYLVSPSGSDIAYTPNGWMNNPTLAMFIDHLDRHAGPDRPIVLLIDSVSRSATATHFPGVIRQEAGGSKVAISVEGSKIVRAIGAEQLQATGTGSGLCNWLDGYKACEIAELQLQDSSIGIVYRRLLEATPTANNVLESDGTSQTRVAAVHTPTTPLFDERIGDHMLPGPLDEADLIFQGLDQTPKPGMKRAAQPPSGSPERIMSDGGDTVSSFSPLPVPDKEGCGHGCVAIGYNPLTGALYGSDIAYIKKGWIDASTFAKFLDHFHLHAGEERPVA